MFYVNTYGIELKNTFRLNNAGFPQNRTIMNIVDLNSASLFIISPSGNFSSNSAGLYTDGTDGIISYTTVSGDFAEAGLYRMQAMIDTSSGVFYSDISHFQVIAEN